MKMRLIFNVLLFLGILFAGNTNTRDTLYILNWNLENLFDTVDDPEKDDNEFLPDGTKQWTVERFNEKIKNLSAVLQTVNKGKGPDLFTVEEIENLSVLKKLANNVSSRNYGFVHFESPDQRGIDCGLVFDSDKFSLLENKALEIDLGKNSKTRQILYAKLKHKEQIFHIYVNHWPSRVGGTEKSEQKRIIAAKTLRQHLDILNQDDKNAKVLILGDFNDEPADSSISFYLGARCSENEKLVNLSCNLKSKGQGTLKYRDDWNMLDQIITTTDFFKGNFTVVPSSFTIIKPEFMTEKDGKYKGNPKPTFGGKNFLGGYSDHFPVLIKIYSK